MTDEKSVLMWVEQVVMYGLQQADRQERLIPLLPDSFGCEGGLSLDDLCDGKLLCAIAISVDPVLANGPTGVAVAARIAFFQNFCRKIGVPGVKIVALPNVWPKPPKNPGILWACLGELGRIVAERKECSGAPKMPAEVATAAASTSATDEEGQEKAAMAAKQAQAEALIAAMAPAQKAETAAEECRRLRASTLVTATVGEGGAPVELAVVPTRDEDESDEEDEDEDEDGEEEERKKEEQRKSAEEQRKRAEEEAQKRKQQEEERKREEDRKKQEEEKRKEEERRRKLEEETRKQEEARRKEEEDKRKKEEEDKKEEERRKMEEAEEERRKEEERVKLEEKRKEDEQQRIQEEETKKLEEEERRKQKEEEEVEGEERAEEERKKEDCMAPAELGGESAAAAEEVGALERSTSQKYVPPEDEEEQDFRADAMPMLHGHLYKLSPSMFKLKKWDRRFFAIRDMHIHWWKKKEEAAAPEAAAPDGGPLCKGTISLLTDPVQLEFDTGSKTKFSLRPESGHWGGEVAKKHGNRVFAFDAADSEYDREEWARVIHAHLEKAKALQVPALDTFVKD